MYIIIEEVKRSHRRLCGSVDKCLFSLISGSHNAVCEHCGKTFASKDSLSKHRKIHTSEKRFKCDVCHKAFLRSAALELHKRIHTGMEYYLRISYELKNTKILTCFRSYFTTPILLKCLRL